MRPDKLIFCRKCDRFLENYEDAKEHFDTHRTNKW